jgi:hypothetical protein
MAHLTGEIRRASIDNRRRLVWANLTAFTALAFVIALILLGPGGAPEPETGQAGVSPPQSQPSG